MVRHVYFGSGPGAMIAAAEDDRRRAERQSARSDRQQWEREWNAVWRPLQDLAATTAVLLNATLLAAGYHQVGGHWRRWRRPMPTTTTTPTPADTGDVMTRLRQLSDLAQRGDRAAAAELGRILDRNPDIWHELGDLNTAIRNAWAKRTTAGDALRSECVLRRVEAIEARLSRPDAPQLERLLVKRVGAAYLVLQLAEIEAAAAANIGGPVAGRNRRDTLARLAVAERTFQGAVKALSLHQTMTRPRPSPTDLLKPLDERAPAGRRTAFTSRLSMAGAGVG
jgi:hypothetical protein